MSVSSHRMLPDVAQSSVKFPSTPGRLVDLNIDFEVCNVREPILSTEELTRDGWTVTTRAHDGWLQKDNVFIPLTKRRGGWFLRATTFVFLRTLLVIFLSTYPF